MDTRRGLRTVLTLTLVFVEKVLREMPSLGVIGLDDLVVLSPIIGQLEFRYLPYTTGHVPLKLVGCVSSIVRNGLFGLRRIVMLETYGPSVGYQSGLRRLLLLCHGIYMGVVLNRVVI